MILTIWLSLVENLFMKSTISKALVWWLPLPVIGFLNGTFRGLVLNRYFSELTARQLSSLLMIVWIVLYIILVYGRLGIRKPAHAWTFGIIWCLLTVAFELVLGYSLGLSFKDMLADYNLADGRLWPFVLIALLVGPILYFRWIGRGSIPSDR